MNSVVLIGRLTRDPELRFVSNNSTAVANFTLAIDKGLTREKKLEFEAAGKPTADFVRIVVWGPQAENASKYLSKGKLVAISGSIQSGSYEDDGGEKRFTTEVLAGRVEYLEWENKNPKGNSQDSHNSFDFSAFEEVRD